MDSNQENEKVNVYRVGKITLLELMAVLAILGILITWVLRSFFAAP